MSFAAKKSPDSIPVVNSPVLRVNPWFFAGSWIATMQSPVPTSQDVDRCEGRARPFFERSQTFFSWAPWHSPGCSMVYLHYIWVSFGHWPFWGFTTLRHIQTIQTLVNSTSCWLMSDRWGKFLDFGMGIWQCRRVSATLQSHWSASLYSLYSSNDVNDAAHTSERCGFVPAVSSSAHCRNFFLPHWSFFEKTIGIFQFATWVFREDLQMLQPADLNTRLLIPIKLEGEAPQPRLDGASKLGWSRMIPFFVC